MKQQIISKILLVLLVFLSVSMKTHGSIMKGTGKSPEGMLNQFLGEPKCDVQIIGKERYPNVIVATDGTVIATWGRARNDVNVRVRRSEDGGITWGPDILIAKGMHGGGALVDETNGNIWIFVEKKHPPRHPQKAMGPLGIYRSQNHGKTWEKIDNITIKADANGYIPQMHMAETGITLQHGKHAGRLLRAARVYDKQSGSYSGGYNTAIYSDDGGKSWQSSAPFPDTGTGEGAVVELSDGRVYYSSRKHLYTVEDYNNILLVAGKRLYAWSYDDGQTWQDLAISKVLPDGPRYRGSETEVFYTQYHGERIKAFSFNSHFGCMGGLARLPVRDRDILLYSNVDTEGPIRERTTVWASFDGGKTWPIKRLVDTSNRRNAGYSSLAVGRAETPSKGWIYLQYESSPPAPSQSMARFNLSWLLEGDLTGDGKLPIWLQY